MADSSQELSQSEISAMESAKATASLLAVMFSGMALGGGAIAVFISNRAARIAIDADAPKVVVQQLSDLSSAAWVYGALGIAAGVVSLGLGLFISAAKGERRDKADKGSAENAERDG